MQATDETPGNDHSRRDGGAARLGKAAEQGGVPKQTLDLVYLRASQINGCSVCVDMGLRFKKADETEERLFAVAARRDAPYFSDSERAALALSEAATRLSDRSDRVPDEIWEAAARHYDERALASLALWIAMTNVWNRINLTTRQVAGEWAKSDEARKWKEKRLLQTKRDESACGHRWGRR